MEIVIVMEYCDGGDLAGKIEQHAKARKYMPEELIWMLFIQLLEGAAHLHSKKLMHRDVRAGPGTMESPITPPFTRSPARLLTPQIQLKSANCFLTMDGRLKIGDMNVSKLARGGFAKTQIGVCATAIRDGLAFPRLALHTHAYPASYRRHTTCRQSYSKVVAMMQRLMCGASGASCTSWRH